MDGRARICVVCCAALLAVAAPAGASSYTVTSGCETFEVPIGVGAVHIEAVGAAGGPGASSAGGNGDVVTATLGIHYKEFLRICAGVGGGAGTGPTEDTRGNGGGASGVAIGTDFSQPVVVAAGGGGGGDGSFAAGGPAGNPSGSAGGSSGNPDGGSGTNGTAALGGKGGTRSTPGAGGTGFANGGGGSSFDASGPGAGGEGGSNDDFEDPFSATAAGGGGGGAGYRGGGGGGASLKTGGGGGGGGADYCVGAGSVSGCTFGPAAETTPAHVTLTWRTADPPSVSITTPADGAWYARLSVVTSRFACTDDPYGGGIIECVNGNGASSGGNLDTNMVDDQTHRGQDYTVHAMSADGLPATKTVTYHVAARPTVSVAVPAANASYQLGEAVSTKFTCTEGAGGLGLSSCLDQAGHESGAALDTATAGERTITITGTSKDGLTGARTIHYTVVAPSSTGSGDGGDQTGSGTPGDGKTGGDKTGGDKTGGSGGSGGSGAGGGGSGSGSGGGGSGSGSGGDGSGISGSGVGNAVKTCRGLTKRSLGVVGRGRKPWSINIDVMVPRAGRVVAYATRGTVRLTGSRTLVRRRGGCAVTTLRLNATGRAQLRAQRRLVVRVVVRFLPRHGHSIQRTRPVRLG